MMDETLFSGSRIYRMITYFSYKMLSSVSFIIITQCLTLEKTFVMDLSGKILIGLSSIASRYVNVNKVYCGTLSESTLPPSL